MQYYIQPLFLWLQRLNYKHLLKFHHMLYTAVTCYSIKISKIIKMILGRFSKTRKDFKSRKTLFHKRLLMKVWKNIVGYVYIMLSCLHYVITLSKTLCYLSTVGKMLVNQLPLVKTYWLIGSKWEASREII